MSKLIAEYLQHPLSASANIALLDDGNVGGVLGATLGSKVDYPSGGSDGDALIKSGASAAWGAAGGLTFVGSESFSAAPSVSLNAVFSIAYENYRMFILVAGSDSGATQGFRFRLRSSGSDDTGGNYDFQTLEAINTSIGGGRSTGQTSWQIGELRTTQVGRRLDIQAPFLSANTFFNSDGQGFTTAFFYSQQSGRLATLTSYDGFTIFPAGGTITGKIEVYGYRAA